MTPSISTATEQQLRREIHTSRVVAKQIMKDRARRRRKETLTVLAVAVGFVAVFWLLAWAVGY